MLQRKGNNGSGCNGTSVVVIEVFSTGELIIRNFPLIFLSKNIFSAFSCCAFHFSVKIAAGVTRRATHMTFDRQ